MDVSKFSPIAKAVVAICGSAVVIVGALAAIASLFTDGVLSQEEWPVLWSNTTVILAAVGLPIAVYKVPNKG